MDIRDLKTWDKFEFAGTTFRVFHEIVETHFGPETLVQVWSPICRDIIGAGQEAMGWKALARLVIEEDELCIGFGRVVR